MKLSYGRLGQNPRPFLAGSFLYHEFPPLLHNSLSRSTKISMELPQSDLLLKSCSVHSSQQRTLVKAPKLAKFVWELQIASSNTVEAEQMIKITALLYYKLCRNILLRTTKTYYLLISFSWIKTTQCEGCCCEETSRQNYSFHSQTLGQFSKPST